MSAVTEAQAAQQWCPFVRPGVSGQHTNCIGRRCMAWRWADGALELHVVRWGRAGLPDPKEGWKRDPEADRRAHMMHPMDREPPIAFSRPVLHPRGYCGLAGQVSSSGS
jgi:hypothetical protein